MCNLWFVHKYIMFIVVYILGLYMATCNQLLAYVQVFAAFKKHWYMYALKGEDSRDA